MRFLKWLLKRRKQLEDFQAEIKVPEPKKKEVGRILEKVVAPGPNETFRINYGEQSPKPAHKVLAPNGVVFFSEWYEHPWLGSDGWIKQPPKYSLPKIEKAVERDRKAREKNK